MRRRDALVFIVVYLIFKMISFLSVIISSDLI